MYNFNLTDTNGKVFSSESLRDKNYIVFFVDTENRELFLNIGHYINSICKKGKIKKEACEILVICKKNPRINSFNYKILVDADDEMAKLFDCKNKRKNTVILVDSKGDKKSELILKEHIEFKVFFMQLRELVEINVPELLKLLFSFDTRFDSISSSDVSKYTSYNYDTIQNHLRKEARDRYTDFYNEVMCDSNKRKDYIESYLEIAKCEKDAGTILGIIDKAIDQDQKVLPEERSEYKKQREINTEEQTAYSLLIYIAILVRQIISPLEITKTKEVSGYLPIRATINPYLNSYSEKKNSFYVSLDEESGFLVKSSIDEDIIDELPLKENLFSFVSLNSPVLICGESGMGKTHILDYFKKELKKERRTYFFIKAFDLYNEIIDNHKREDFECIYDKYFASQEIILIDGLNEVFASGYNSFDEGTKLLSYFFKEYILKNNKIAIVTGIVGYKYVEVKNQFAFETIIQLDGLKNKDNTDFLRIPIYENIRRELGISDCTTYGLVDSLYEHRCKKLSSIPDEKSEEYFCFLDSLPEKAFNLLSGKEICLKHNEIPSLRKSFEFSPFVEIIKDHKQQIHAFFSHDIYVVYFASKFILDRVRNMKKPEYRCFFSDEDKVSFDKFQPSFTFREMLVSAFFTNPLNKKLVRNSNVLVDGLDGNIPFSIKLMLIEIYYIIADALGDPFWGEEATKNLKKEIQLKDKDFYDKTINIFFKVLKNGINGDRSILLNNSNRWLTRQILCRKQIQLLRIKEKFDQCLEIINEMEDIFKNEKDFMVELEHQRAKIYLDRRKDVREFRDGLNILEKIVNDEKTFTFSINLLGMIKAYPTPAVVKLLECSERQLIEGFEDYYKLIEATRNDSYIEPSTGYTYRRIAAMLLFNHVEIRYCCENNEIPLLSEMAVRLGKDEFPSQDNITLATLILEKADDHSYTEFLKALLYYYKGDYSLASSFVEQAKKQGENGIMLRMIETEISNCSEKEKNEIRNSLIQEINEEGTLPERVKKSILNYNTICEKYTFAYVVFDIFRLMKAIEIKNNNDRNVWIRLWEQNNFHKDPLFTNSFMEEMGKKNFSETEMVFWSSLLVQDKDIDNVYGRIKKGR